MINASGSNSVTPETMPQAGAAPAGVPVAAAPQATQTTTAPTTPAASGFSGTTPPTAGNSSVSDNGKKLKKPPKKLPWKMILGGVFLVLVLVGAIAGYFLTQTNQDVRQQASVERDAYKEGGSCTTGDTQCNSSNQRVVCVFGKWSISGSCNDKVNVKDDPGDGGGDGDALPASSSSTDSRQQCLNQIGSNAYYNQSGTCDGTWSDFLCRCVTPDDKACFTTNDQCASFNTNNCGTSNSYDTNFECRDALGDGSGGGDTLPEPSTSTSLQQRCINQLGNFTAYDSQTASCSGRWSDALCRCVTETDTTSSTSEDSLPQPSSSPGTSSTSFKQQCQERLFGNYNESVAVCSGTWSDYLCRCITGADLACFTTNDQCATFNTSNCQNGNNYANSNDCRAALSASGFNECTQNDIATCRQAGGNCVYNSNLNRGQCVNITAGDDCTSNATCQANGGNLVCSGGRCVQPTSSSSSQAIAASSNDADGTGSCAECLGLGGQSERDCYAQCSGTIATGICAGLTAEQCAQACNAYTGATTQICAGTQEAAGTARAGEFLSCGASSTNGCGQVDCLVGDELVGFVIDNSQCTGSGGPSTTTVTNTSTSTNTPQPTLNPTLAACGQGCSTDNNCADANHSCVEGVCRLTSNPDSATCTEPDGTSPTPVPQPSPTPLPSPDPDLASCNEACTTSADCADLNHSCQSGVCRLTDYPSSATCTEPDGTSPTPVPRTEETPLECNDPCTSDSDCSSFNHVCHNDRCRLSTNLDNISCTEPVVYQGSTDLGQISQQPGAPGVLPSAGASDLKNWLLTGLGAIGVGAVILLLL